MPKAATIVIMFMFGFLSTAPAQGDFDHVSVNSISSGPVVRVGEIDAFAELAQQKGVSTILVPEASGLRDSRFAFAHDGVIYQTDADGFRTIADYRRGKRLSFRNGYNYYHAQRLGFETSEGYEYFTSQWFLSPADVEDAAALGYRGTANADFKILLPPIVAQEDFEQVLLPLLIRAQLEGRYDVDRSWSRVMSETFSELGDDTWSYAVIQDMRQIGGRSSRNRLSERSRIPSTGQGRPGNLASRLSPYGVQKLTDRLHSRALDDEEDITATRVGYRWRSGQYELEGKSIVRQWSPRTDGDMYYLASLHGYDEFAEFRADHEYLEDVLVRGFESIEDAKAAEETGFSRADQFYEAADEGFRNHADYRMGTRLRVDSGEYYSLYKPVIEQLDRLRDRFGIEDYGDAVLLHVFDQVEAGRTIAISAVQRTARSFVGDYPALQHLSRRPLVTQPVFQRFVPEHASAIEELGTLNSEDGVFTGGNRQF